MPPVDAWEFDYETLALTNGLRRARLTRKTADVLACLMRNKGKVVSPETLLREVWPGLHVTPHLVREYIFDLRSVLGDDARAPNFIETVRGRGYRLVGDVRAVRVVPAATAVPLLRVAVLGLADRSLNPRWKRLALALADDIAAELSRYPDMAVVARHAVAATAPGADLREIAERLGVRYVVAGALDIEGDFLRLQFELVDGQTSHIRWTRRITRPTASLPQLIEEVSASIAGSLGGLHGEIQRLERDLVRRKPPASLDAYEHYLLGVEAEARHDGEGMQLALQHLETALQLDPGFARSWVLLGWTCYQIKVSGWFEEPEEWDRREREAIEKAFQRDPRDPLIISTMANQLARKGRSAEALSLIERAVDLAENQADACASLTIDLAMVVGDGRRALALVDRCLELNPSPLGWHKILECQAAFFAGAYERSIQSAAAATDSLPKYVCRCLSAAALGWTDQTRDFWLDLIKAYPKFDAEKYAADSIVSPAALRHYQSAVTKLRAMLA